MLLLGLAVLLCFQVGGVFAETPLNETVKDLIGVDYKYGGTSEKGFDCSGFTMFVFNQWNIDLPHTSKGQAEDGTKVSKDDLQPGDLIFFNTGGAGISHVGIYLGDGKFIHSASNKGVTINKLSEAYYVKRYVTARRILDEKVYTKLTTDGDQAEAELAVK